MNVGCVRAADLMGAYTLKHPSSGLHMDCRGFKPTAMPAPALWKLAGCDTAVSVLSIFFLFVI